LVPGLVACLVALPLTVLALVFVTSPASRDDNGVGLTPAMGWSSWSFLRDRPTETSIEAEAKAVKDSGLAGVGYQFVNLDDFWYQCPGRPDGIDASRIAAVSTYQTFAKTEKNGDVVVGLFNVSGAPQVISTSVSALGMKARRDYLLTDLWTHCRTQTTGTISAEVPSHGVALFRISPLRNPAAAPSAAISNPSLVGTLAGGLPDVEVSGRTG
jgi:hypothetical protein